MAVRGTQKPSAGEATRAKIIAAALDTLHEEGIVGTSARSIAARGGFNQGLIFYHFGGINELLLAAVDELSRRREERYRERLKDITTLSALVSIAGELHQQDMEDGHITVLTQMLAGVATNPELREPLRERFQLLGYRDDTTRLIAAADLFVLASHHEGLPVTVMEALTLGVPVVAPRVGGLPEVVESERNGILVTPDSPSALAKAIERASDPAVRASLVAGAGATGDRFDSAPAYAHLDDLYLRSARERH